jgi:hypothetical protein
VILIRSRTTGVKRESFFGDDAKGDGSATAADAAHDGVVVTVKKENEPSVQEVAR